VASAMVNADWLKRIAPPETELRTIEDRGWMYQVLDGEEGEWR